MTKRYITDLRSGFLKTSATKSKYFPKEAIRPIALNFYKNKCKFTESSTNYSLLLNFDMRLILNKTYSLYIFIILMCIILNSCSALKTCDCPGIETHNNSLENPHNSKVWMEIVSSDSWSWIKWTMQEIKNTTEVLKNKKNLQNNLGN